jgi:hypothetical protein
VSLRLLLKEIRDPYIRENFQRILREFENVGLGGGDTINNITNITNLGLWTGISDAVNGSSSKVIDSISLGDFHTVKYNFSVYNDTESKTKTFEMTVNKEGSVVSDSVSNKMGSTFNMSIGANVNAGNMELTLFNNEIFNLTVSAAKLVLE